MRRLMAVFQNQRSTGTTIVNQSFRHAARLLAVASVLAFASASADDPAATGKKSAGKGAVLQTKAESEQSAIPDCLEKLKLTSSQQAKIKEIIRSYDSSIATVWKHFSGRYMQAINMESSLLAAIEDNLTDTQRQQVRDQRHKTAQHEKMIEATSEKPNQSTTKPASAVEDELAGVGVTLTTEQEAAADKVQEKYRAQMRSMKRDIEGLHIRLVSLEADKLVAIEKVLTKEQLAELREHRQNAPEMKSLELTQVESTKK